jgi:hypothetical protein
MCLIFRACPEHAEFLGHGEIVLMACNSRMVCGGKSFMHAMPVQSNMHVFACVWHTHTHTHTFSHVHIMTRKMHVAGKKVLCVRYPYDVIRAKRKQLKKIRTPLLKKFAAEQAKVKHDETQTQIQHNANKDSDSAHGKDAANSSVADGQTDCETRTQILQDTHNTQVLGANEMEETKEDPGPRTHDPDQPHTHHTYGIEVSKKDVVAFGLSGKLIASGAVRVSAKVQEDMAPVPVSPLFFVDGFPSLPSLMQPSSRRLAAFRWGFRVSVCTGVCV